MNLATTLSLPWALLAQARPMMEALGPPGSRVRWATLLGYLLLGLALAWSAATYFTLHTKGVTGSDPYAYVQMAVDLAQRGSLLHRFDLVPRVAEWGLPLWPLVPVGYRPPAPQTGEASTVWPPGYSAFLSIAYLLGGETGLYTLTPFLGLATLLALWFLCLEILRPWQDDWRFLATGIATLILATSYQQVEHALIPMADIPSQLFTTLMVFFALRGIRGHTVLFAILSGFCLGIAFAIRYTQVLMGFSVLAAAPLYFSRYHLRYWRIIVPVVCFTVSAWIPALVVLWYHQIAFGNPFSVGSEELKLFGWEYLPVTFVRILRDLFRTNEFFYVAPFLVWGVFRLWHRSRQVAAALWVGLVVTILFHLFYAALRLRDLLSVLPVLALFTGLGIGDLLSQVHKTKHSLRQKLCLVVAFTFIVTSLGLRTRVTWQLPFSGGFNTFGYLLASQREAFNSLASLTPSTGIVAASLNSGPIGLYAGRDAVRPAYWSENEWLAFVANALADGRRVLLLLDGDDMKRAKQVVQSRYHLVLVSQLPLPYFYPGGRSDNISVILYEVIP